MSRGWAFVWGAVLVGAGALALLFNLGLIQPEQIDRVVVLWPLILILIGADIVLARLAPRQTAAITMAVIVFFVVAGSVGYVVSAPPLREAHRSFTATDAGSGPATLRVDLGAGTVQVTASSLQGEAAEVGYDYASRPGDDPKLSWDPGSRVLEVSRSMAGLPFGPSTPDRLHVTLNAAVTWTLQFNTGASTITADMAAARLAALRVDGGAVTVQLRLGAPAGQARIDVNGGATHLDLTRPAGAALHVELQGGANSLVADGRNIGGALGSISWSSDGYPAADAYLVLVDGGANRVTVSQSA